MRSVLVAGVFDYFHEGHKEFLRKCRVLAGDGRLIVMVNSDEFTKNYKGITPTFNEIERANAIRESGLADQVFILPRYEDQRDMLNSFRPTLVVHGTDWTGERLYQQFGVTKEWLDRKGILFCYVDTTPGISSTMLREAK